MIIIEGVDKAGKTTLANKLAKEFLLPIKKFGIPNGDPIPEYIKELENQVDQCIYDRFLYGEVPYSIVKKRMRYMQYLQLRVLDLMVQLRPHLIIYCRPKRDVIVERLKELGDNYIDREEAMRLYEEYDMLFEEVNSNVTFFSGDQDYPNVVAKILSMRADSTRSFSHWKNFKYPGIGTLSPRYLFIGEKYNYNAPYQVTFCSKSGEYLFKCLDNLKFDMNECHFTNAYDGEDIISSDLINFLKPEKIICLGDIAYNAVTRKDIRANWCLFKIPHPSYWARFHSADKDHYLAYLRECK